MFYYGKTNPCLPQDVPTNGVPMFQTYPMESFILPEKFEAMLGISKTCNRQVTLTNFVSEASFKDQCVSKAILETETIRYDILCKYCTSIIFTKGFFCYNVNLIVRYLF